MAEVIGNYLVIFGGIMNSNDGRTVLHKTTELWIVNTSDISSGRPVTWTKATTQGDSQPPSTAGASCISASDLSLHMFGGRVYGGSPTTFSNELWRLERDGHSFTWTKEPLKTEVAPRTMCKGFAWEGSLYIFGGVGPAWAQGQYKKDQLRYYNQLVSIDLAEFQVEIMSHSGDIPSGRASHALAIVDSRAYLHGGRDNEKIFDDFYCLDLVQIVWTKVIPSSPIAPNRCSSHSLTTLNDGRIFLHSYIEKDKEPFLQTTYIFTLSENSWQPIRNKFIAGYSHSSTSPDGQTVLIFGGSTKKHIKTSRLFVHTFKTTESIEDGAPENHQAKEYN